MNPTIAKAVAAGIPVVLLNAGCDPADLAATHAITCVGQPEEVAGERAGTVFASQGATNVLCVIHQSGQNLLDRCNGLAQALGVGPTCHTGTAPSTASTTTDGTLTRRPAVTVPGWPSCRLRGGTAAGGPGGRLVPDGGGRGAG
jgi:simple sugar transport system substrate-binding protein